MRGKGKKKEIRVGVVCELGLFFFLRRWRRERKKSERASEKTSASGRRRDANRNQVLDSRGKRYPYSVSLSFSKKRDYVLSLTCFERSKQSEKRCFREGSQALTERRKKRKKFRRFSFLWATTSKMLYPLFFAAFYKPKHLELHRRSIFMCKTSHNTSTAGTKTRGEERQSTGVGSPELRRFRKIALFFFLSFYNLFSLISLFAFAILSNPTKNKNTKRAYLAAVTRKRRDEKEKRKRERNGSERKRKVERRDEGVVREKTRV